MRNNRPSETQYQFEDRIHVYMDELQDLLDRGLIGENEFKKQMRNAKDNLKFSGIDKSGNYIE